MVQVGNHLNPMDFREWQGIFSVNHGVSLHPPPWFVHGGLNLAAWIFTKKPKGNHPDGARRSLDHPVRRRRHSRDSPGAPWGAAGSGASAKCRGRPSTKRRSVGKRTKSWRKKKWLMQFQGKLYAQPENKANESRHVSISTEKLGAKSPLWIACKTWAANSSRGVLRVNSSPRRCRSIGWWPMRAQSRNSKQRNLMSHACFQSLSHRTSQCTPATFPVKLAATAQVQYLGCLPKRQQVTLVGLR